MKSGDDWFIILDFMQEILHNGNFNEARYLCAQIKNGGLQQKKNFL
jgi:hypothetical protein